MDQILLGITSASIIFLGWASLWHSRAIKHLIKSNKKITDGLFGYNRIEDTIKLLANDYQGFHKYLIEQATEMRTLKQDLPKCFSTVREDIYGAIRTESQSIKEIVSKQPDKPIESYLYNLQLAADRYALNDTEKRSINRIINQIRKEYAGNSK